MARSTLAWGFTSSEDDNVLVRGVAGDIGALGFFGFAYVDENKDKLRALAVAAARVGVPSRRRL